jgi:6-phosphogluconate dehydrogenase
MTNMQQQYEIGMVDLGVMGRNFVLNIAIKTSRRKLRMVVNGMNHRHKKMRTKS